MRTLLRGLAGAVLVAGLAALGAGPGGLSAQDKKKDAKTPAAPPAVKKDDPKAKPDDTPDRTVGISTSDGLSLKGYWFQGNAIDKAAPDAVMMFPAPGNKVTDAWIGLAKTLSEKNFSVLLFDWRGCGMNAPEAAGTRIFAEPTLFWGEPYNKQLLSRSQKQIDDKGLAFSMIQGRSDARMRYRDFMFNDLTAARFYLDKMNDNGKCNTNRVWIVTERDGGHLGLAFIASEFLRNTIYNPKSTGPLEFIQYKAAGKDYIGLTTLSFATNPTAAAVIRNTRQLANNNVTKELNEHLEHRLAMVMVYGDKERDSGSRSAFGLVGAGGDEEALKKNYKYLRKIDNAKAAKSVSGIDLIDPMDTYQVQKLITDTMVGISKAMPTGKDKTDREANKMTVIPRFRAEDLGRR